MVRMPLTVLYVGVLGEAANESEYFLVARWMGRKMPAPGTVVVK